MNVMLSDGRVYPAPLHHSVNNNPDPYIPNGKYRGKINWENQTSSANKKLCLAKDFNLRVASHKSYYFMFLTGVPVLYLVFRVPNLFASFRQKS